MNLAVALLASMTAAALLLGVAITIKREWEWRHIRRKK